MPERNALLVGMSGVSSSGKTTLARLLRDVFPRVFLVHEDDFYKTDAEIPVKDGVADWDCLESLNLPALEAALVYIKAHGRSPPDITSQEDQNAVGHVDVDQSRVDALKWQASMWMYENVPPVYIIDGFLLYSEGMQRVRDLFDVKLFLRTGLQTAKARREARNGYVTLEGFWQDPPGYVDRVVWPNYVQDHAFLFKDGDVEGELDEAKLKELDLHALPLDVQGNMTACLEWAYTIIEKALKDFRE